MKILKIPQKNWVSETAKHIMGSLHNTGYCIVESPVVVTYRKNKINESLCEQLGYEIYELFSNSGTFVSNAGDVGIGHCGDINNAWCNNFISYFVNWLSKRGLNATTEKNDILVDGYKVCGMCVTRYGMVDYSCGLIGINTKLDHIKQICTKPMVKVPKGLSDYNITTEEIEQMFLDFCKQENEHTK